MENWMDVLMTGDAKGAVLGVHAMQFEKDKTYRVDLPLAQSFLQMGVCAFSANPQNLQVLHVKNDVASWGPEIDE